VIFGTGLEKLKSILKPYQMKKNLTLIISFVMLYIMGYSQDKVNLVIFSEDSEPFYVFVNGVKQSKTAETNVRFTDLTPNISLRIEFENKALPQIKQDMSLEPGFEHTARIIRDKKMQMKLRYFGQVALSEAKADNSVATVKYHSADDGGDVHVETVENTTVNNGTKSTTTQIKTESSNSENASINISMPGVGISMNISDPLANTTVNSTTSSTVTKSTSSSGYNDTPTKTEAVSPSSSIRGCAAAMTSASFNKMKESVASKPFSETKMSTAKVATKNSCLSVNQIKEITKLFSMDEDKLTYAKYAYDYCVDKANYYQVGDVFSFSSTTDELNAFLEH